MDIGRQLRVIHVAEERAVEGAPANDAPVTRHAVTITPGPIPQSERRHPIGTGAPGA
jgi:hypothetical protein